VTENYWKFKLRLISLFLVVLLFSGCRPAEDVSPEGIEQANMETPQRTLTVMTHDSFAVSEWVIQEFEDQNQAHVIFVKSGDTGSALNRAILSRENPIADVFYGVDNTFLTRALEEDIFEPYETSKLDTVPDIYELDPEFRVTPVDYGDVCINYDKAYFAEHGMKVPQSLEELLSPEYAELLVVENPATSSTGLAFLMATIAHFGEDGYLDYWKALRENGVVVVNDWETAYYTNFSGSSGLGPQPMVVSYGSSPAAEVIYAEEPLDEAPTGSIIGPETCFRQVEFVGILKGTENRDLAERFVDFMLSVTFQQDMPEQMFVFPVNSDANLSEVFVKNVQIPDQPAVLDPLDIGNKREIWINAWDEVVLR
jgi:thiamine transport system substrate-binding protein